MFRKKQKNRTKKFIVSSFIGLFVILISGMTFLSIPQFNKESSAQAYSGGSGSAGDPYLISNESDLNDLRNSTKANQTEGKFFLQTKDINLTSNWEAIGIARCGWTEHGNKAGMPFLGTYDGGFFRINNLKSVSSALQTTAGTDNSGFFNVNSGTIKNVILGNGSTNGQRYTGSIAAVNMGTIENCINEGVVVNGFGETGGIVGYNFGTVTKCTNKAQVNVTRQNQVTSDGNHAGGIVGMNRKIISECMNLGDVKTTTNCHIGGITGWNVSATTILDCYVKATISSTDRAGTIVGNQEASSSGWNSAVLKNTIFLGTLYSNWEQSITRPSNMGDNDSSRINNYYYGTSKKDLPSGFSSDIWSVGMDGFNDGNIFPKNNALAQISNLFGGLFNGEGTEADPYRIEDLTKFKTLRDKVNEGIDFIGKYFKQTSNIDLNNEEWTPIGTITSYNNGGVGGNSFKGTYDGDNHFVMNLSINNSRMGNGLFGFIQSQATIKNLILYGGSIYSSNAPTGALVAASYGKIENCINLGVNIDTNSVAGGIAGFAQGNIIKCYNFGNISKSRGNAAVTSPGQGSTDNVQVGGIAGIGNLNITECGNYGNITSSSAGHVGGIIGIYLGGTMVNTMNSGNVANNGNDRSSGLTVRNNGTIHYCYNSGSITGPYNSPFVNSGLGASATYSSNFTSAPSSLSGTSFGPDWALRAGYNGGYPMRANGIFDPAAIGLNGETVVVDSYNDMVLIAINVISGRSNYNGKTIQLLNNVDFKNENWVPIGTLKYNGTSSSGGSANGNAFQGTFDGDGKEIFNFKIDVSGKGENGLFAFVGNNGTIKNLTVRGSLKAINSSNINGVFAAWNDGNIINCNNRTNVESNGHAGGIVGFNSATGKITNSQNNGIISFIGSVGNTIILPSQEWGVIALGGISGINNGVISKCINNNEVKSSVSTHMGGISGWMSGSLAQIDNSINAYSVSSPADRAGAIVSTVNRVNANSIINCLNYGVISYSAITYNNILNHVAGGSNYPVKNCYTNSNGGSDSTGVIYLAPSDSSWTNGEIAWKLNTTDNTSSHSSIWTYNIVGYPTFSNGSNATYKLSTTINGKGTSPLLLYYNGGTTVNGTFVNEKGYLLNNYVFNGTTYTNTTINLAMPKQDVILTVTFNPITYKITYSSNDSRYLTKTVDITYDQFFNFADANLFAYPGFTFIEWNSDPMGNGTSYGAGSSNFNLDFVNDRVTNIYAIQRLDDITVTAPNNLTVDYNGQANLLNLNVNHGAKDSATYKWYKDGVPYIGSVTGGVSLTNVNESGEYFCEISINLENQSKSVTSGKFIVVINKINYNTSGFTFGNQQLVYNGQAQHAVISGNLPIGFDNIPLTVTYNGQATNVRDGEQTVTATFSTISENYNTPSSMTAIVKIIPAEYDMTNVIFEDREIVYNNISHSIEISGNLPQGLDGISVAVRYEGSAISVSKTTIRAIFTTASSNYNVPLTKEAVLNITHAEYDMRGIAFNDATFDYNGRAQNPTLEGSLPIGLDGISITVSYQGAVTDATDASGSTVYANFATVSQNYKTPSSLSAKVVINKIHYNIDNITFSNASLKYNGSLQNHTISGELPTGLDGIRLSVRYEGGATNVDDGAILVKAIFETNSNNYFVPQTMESFVTIITAEYDMSDVQFDDATFVYDGNAHTVVINDNQLPIGKDGIKISATVQGSVTNVRDGRQMVTATFATTSTNYKVPAPMIAYIIVTPSSYDMSGISFIDTIEFDYNGQIQRPSILGTLPIGADNIGLTVSYEGAGINASDYTVRAVFTSLSDNYTTPTAMVSRVKINKISYDIHGITFDSQSFEYNGTPQRPAINGLLPVGLDGIKLSVSYQGFATNVSESGTLVTAIFNTDSINYKVPNNMTANVTITKANYEMGDISFLDGSLPYNGRAQHHVLKGTLPIGLDNIPLTVRYEGSATSVTDGEVNVKAIFDTLSGNYNVPTEMTSKFHIIKADYAMNGIKFLDESFTFDNRDHSLSISGLLPIGEDMIRVTVSYEGKAKYVSDGRQKVTAVFATESPNYNAPMSMEAFVSINKANYNINNISYQDFYTVYNGQPQYPVINGVLPMGLDGEYLQVRYNGYATNVTDGKVVVFAEFFTLSGNYNIPNNLSASVTIKPYEIIYSPSMFSKNYGEDNTKIQESIVTSINSETVLVTYTREIGEDAGFYNLVSIYHPNQNYDIKFAENENIDKFEIKKIDYNLSHISLSSQTVIYNGQEQSLVVSGDLPIGLDGIKVVANYSHTLRDVGEVNVLVTFSTESGNYNLPTLQLNATLKVNPIVLSFSKNQAYIGIIGETSNIDLVEGEHFIVNNVLLSDTVDLEYTAAFEDETASKTIIFISFISTGNNNYAFPSTDYQFVIDAEIAKDIIMEFSASDYVFDNLRHTPSVIVTLGSRQLNTYTILYYTEDNINIGHGAPNNAGTYRMEVKATHSHAATVTESFYFTIERTEAIFLPNPSNKLTQTYGDFYKLTASFVGKFNDMRTEGVVSYSFSGRIPLVGQNVATATFYGDKNYLPMTEKINFEVEKRDLFVNINYDYFNYSGKPYQATYTVNNAISADENIITVYVGDRLTQTNVGIYPVDIILNNANYNVVKTGATDLNIIKAPLTVGVLPPEKMILDTDTVEFEMYFIGFMEGDSISDLKELPRIQQSQFKAGVHTVLPVNGYSDNYFFIYKPQTINVNYNNINFEGANNSNIIIKGIYEYNVKADASEVNGSKLMNGFYNSVRCAYYIQMENVTNKEMQLVINNNKIKFSMFTSVYFIDDNGNKTKLSAASFNNGMLELTTNSVNGYIVVVDNYILIYILLAAIIVLLLIVIKLVRDKKRFVDYVESKNFWMREDS